jgi:HEPN domain-containing protein
MKPATIGWLESAKMDLDNVEYIKKDEHLTPVIAFHSQQAVEKSLKAILEEGNLDTPKTHDLIYLFKESSKVCELDLDKKKLTKLNELYIEARYPGELGLLPEGKPTLTDAQQFYEFARDIYNRVKQTLEKNHSAGEGS